MFVFSEGKALSSDVGVKHDFPSRPQNSKLDVQSKSYRVIQIVWIGETIPYQQKAIRSGTIGVENLSIG